MRSNMIGFIAFDLVLQIIFTGMMCIAFIVEIGSVDFYDLSGYMSCFRIPSHVIADLEFVCHDSFFM